MLTHTISGREVTPREALQGILVDSKAAIYIAEFPAGGAAATFTEADNYSDVLVGDVSADYSREGSERVTVSGRTIRANGRVTFEARGGVELHAAEGTPKFARLEKVDPVRGKAVTGGNPGGDLAVLLFSEGRSGFKGILNIDKLVTPMGSDEGYFHLADLVYSELEYFPASDNPVAAPVVTPTFTSKTPVSGPIGTTTTATGTGFTPVTAAQFRTTGTTTVVATQNTFGAGRTATSLPFAVPAGLTVGTSYDVFLVHPNGAVAAGSFAVIA